MGKHHSADQISSLAKQRGKLVKSLAKFNAEGRKIMGLDAFNECVKKWDADLDDLDDGWDPVDPPDIPPETVRPELSCIALPSALPLLSHHRNLLAPLMQKEFELRRGHANDSLAAIRANIGHQAFQYKKTLRPAQTKIHRTRARSAIQAVNRELVLHCRVYKRTRQAMLDLQIEPDTIKDLYQPVTKRDLDVKTAVKDPNVAGSTRVQLSWIWLTHQGIQKNDNHLTECESF